MFTSLLIRITNRYKPLLVRLLPIQFLRCAKSLVVNRSVRGLSRDRILPFNRTAHPDGINLIGFIRGEIGLGQSCRLVAYALEASKQAFTIYNYQQISAMRHEDHSWDHKITDTLPYNINLIHINPYEMPLAFLQMKQQAWDYRYNIGFWLWELEVFPEEWLPALNLVDEIWTPSEHASASVRSVTDKPVFTVPYPISAPVSPALDRSSFGLPDHLFLVLCMYDCNSTMERKNPMGAIAAYKQAYGKNNDGVGLVIKVNNPQKADLDKLRAALASYPNIFLLDGVMDKLHVNSLISAADVYISLHRAEGFGLVPAEAMLLGTPVIATNWSSNTEFMNCDVACMVNYSFTEIQEDIGHYKKGNRWAEPDTAQAAEYLTRLFLDRHYYMSISEKARTHIATILSPQQAAARINRRIADIYCEQSNIQKTSQK